METKQISPEEIPYGEKACKPILRNNFILMTISGALILIGFIFMTGGSSETSQYNPEIFSTRRIVVGPMFCFIGYVLMAVSIIIKPKRKI